MCGALNPSLKIGPKLLIFHNGHVVVFDVIPSSLYLHFQLQAMNMGAGSGKLAPSSSA